jgi:CubicO group peptidase (beta-lactamase class C family)
MNTQNYPLPDANPEELGFSAERLGRIRPAMQEFIDKKMVPNVVTLIARDGKIVYFEAQGYQDIEKGELVSKDSIFRLYSNSKPVAGVALMMLYEDGLLHLDDPVSKYIPAFQDPMIVATNMMGPPRQGPPSLLPLVPASREITIRDCVRNTTGLASPLRSPFSVSTMYANDVAESGWNLLQSLNTPPKNGYKARVEAHARLPLASEPGTEFLYHVGYPIIGVGIEEIVGKTLEEFYQERIFRPLGMNDTSFYLDESKLDRFSACYQPKREGDQWTIGIFDKPETSEKLKGPKIYFGTGGDMGGLLSTASDYARFSQMLLNKGELEGVRLLGRKSVELMTSSHTGDMVIPMFGPGFGFGIGVGVYLGGSPRLTMRSIGTFGWGGAAGTTFFVDPKEKLFAICFTQVFNHLMMPGKNYQDEFERLVYQALV